MSGVIVTESSVSGAIVTDPSVSGAVVTDSKVSGVCNKVESRVKSQELSPA